MLRRIKERIGLIPAELDAAIEIAKQNSEKFQVIHKVEGTNIVIDLDKRALVD